MYAYTVHREFLAFGALALFLPFQHKMAEAILQKLGACKSLLSALSNRPGYGKASAIEAQRVQALLRASPLGTEDMGKVAEAIQAAGFAESDAAAILDTVADSVSSGGMAQPVGKVPRVTTQDYIELQNYLVPSVMARLTEEKAVSDLMDHLLRLGLRNPSEPSFRMIAVLVLFATEGFEQTREMSTETKYAFLQTIKDTFRSRANKVASPVFFVDALPRDPEKFKRDWPSLYAAAFNGSAPMPPPISELESAILKKGFRCRKERGFSASSALELALASSRGSSSAAMPAMPANLLQFGQAMAGQMQMLAQEIANLKKSPSEPLLTLLKPPAPAPQAAKLALPGSGTVPEPAAAEPTAPAEPPAPRLAPATLPEVADPEKAAEEAKAETNIERVSSLIRTALDENKGKAKAKAKGKGKTTAKAKAKAKAAVKVAAIGKSRLTSKPPPMPAFKKNGPIYWGSCTIYTDFGKGLWRATEAANRRKDLKFKWSKDNWQRLLTWCLENGHDL